jgi:PAS domain S-box-containing protein
MDNDITKNLMDTTDGVFIVDSELRIHMWNNAAEKILGFSKGDVEGKFCYQIIRGSNEAGDFICRKHCQILKMALRSEPISNYDTRLRTRDGDICWLNMSIIILQSRQHGNDLMIVHMFRDISEKNSG